MKILHQVKSTLICLFFIVLGSLFKLDVLFIFAIVVGGYKETVNGIRDSFTNKRLNIELLMIMSAIGACVINYYSEGAVLIFIFSLANNLEEITLDKSKREIRNLLNVQPKFAMVSRGENSFEEMRIEELVVGDTVLIAVGELVPIDSIIINGTSNLNESMITGESIPVMKKKGDIVYGGTLNISNPLTVLVNTNHNDTLIQRIVRMVEDAQQYNSTTAKFIDKIEGIYALSVVVLVVLVVLFFMIIGKDFSFALYKGIILLVVASPCALIASVTPATISAISNAAKRGVLVKGGIHLENLMNINTFIFDKTGTLTQGYPEVVESYYVTENNILKEAIVKLELFSNHPLANAIVKHLSTELTLSSEKPNDVEEVSGFGVKGKYMQKNYLIGRVELMTDFDFDYSILEKWTKKGMSIIVVQEDSKVVAAYGIRDQIRTDAKELITWLNANNYMTVMVTGDTENTAVAIAEELGISKVIAKALPEDKANIIGGLIDEFGHVLMIGDGINDAPALAQATVGVAMGEGTDIAIESADIILVKNSILNLKYMINLSHKLKSIINQNIFFSLIVIIILIILNFSNLITLPFGVVMHEGSTILVILNGLRMLKNKF